MADLKEADYRYREVLADLRLLTHCAFAISSSVRNKKTHDEREWYAAAIFSKIVSQSITLIRSLPTGLELSPESGAQLWDAASACCLARAIIDAYDALAYIAVHPESLEKAELRIKVWELHDKERRAKMLRLIGSTSLMAEEITKEAEELRPKILSDPLAKDLHPSSLGKIKNGETPDFLATIEAHCSSSNINYNYYVSAKMFLSSHVHTHPFAIHQLLNFKAGDPASLVLLSVPARYATAFLAKAVEGMRSIFGNSLPAEDEASNGLISVWIGIAKKGVNESAAS